MTEYLRFKELHYQEKPLLLGNVWNAQSAKILEELNFKALATSSAAIAHSLGYEDGEQMSFEELFYVVERVRKSLKTSIPLSVDLESGYGENAHKIAENIVRLSKIGVVGINLEDSFVEGSERKLKDADEFSDCLKTISMLLKKENIEIFINARCDAFLVELPNALEEAIRRMKLYERTGINGIFLPCIAKEHDIKSVLSQTELPLNVMLIPQLHNFDMLSDLGVSRISMGNSLNSKTYEFFKNISQKTIKEELFNFLF